MTLRIVTADQRLAEANVSAGREDMRARDTLDTALIKRTLDIWQPRSQRPLNGEDARQIIKNFAGFFRLLAEWAAAEASQDGKRVVAGGIVAGVARWKLERKA